MSGTTVYAHLRGWRIVHNRGQKPLYVIDQLFDRFTENVVFGRIRRRCGAHFLPGVVPSIAQA
jgi:hypothetical protein